VSPTPDRSVPDRRGLRIRDYEASGLRVVTDTHRNCRILHRTTYSPLPQMQNDLVKP
jgi:hypothetical protein